MRIQTSQSARTGMPYGATQQLRKAVERALAIQTGQKRSSRLPQTGGLLDHTLPMKHSLGRPLRVPRVRQRSKASADDMSEKCRSNGNQHREQQSAEHSGVVGPGSGSLDALLIGQQGAQPGGCVHRAL